MIFSDDITPTDSGCPSFDGCPDTGLSLKGLGVFSLNVDGENTDLDWDLGWVAYLGEASGTINSSPT